MFSECYFYLAAFIDDKKVREYFNVINDSFPTIYRIDRIQGLKVLNEKYHIPPQSGLMTVNAVKKLRNSIAHRKEFGYTKNEI